MAEGDISQNIVNITIKMKFIVLTNILIRTYIDKCTNYTWLNKYYNQNYVKLLTLNNLQIAINQTKHLYLSMSFAFIKSRLKPVRGQCMGQIDMFEGVSIR